MTLPSNEHTNGEASPTETAEVTVPVLLAGERLDRVLAMLADVSRSVATGWVNRGDVAVDNTVLAKPSHRMTEGQVIRFPIEVPVEEEPLTAEPGIVFPVVYEDEHVLVIDKPPGLVVHPGAGQSSGTLVHGLLARYPEIRDIGPDPHRPGIVHRIDKDTSGLLMVARSAAAYEELVSQLQDRSVGRHYLALVWGHMAVSAGMVDGGIGRSRRDPTKMAVSATGKDARTRYNVDQVFTKPVDVSLLRCSLLSGRTHQIRVHMQSIGHAVVGDPTYHGIRQSFPLPRMFLHAASLAFDHPMTGEHLAFESGLPADLREALGNLS